MRNLTCLYIILLLATSCKPGRENEQPDDSLITKKDGATLMDDTENDSTLITAEDAADIRSAVDKLIEEEKMRGSNAFTLRLNSSGYEFQTDAIWTFDSLFNLVHCYQQGSSEGAEGETHYLFRQDQLYAVHDANEYDGGKDITIFHRELGGITYGENSAGKGIEDFKPLPTKYLKNTERDVLNQLAEIVNLLRNHKSEITQDDPSILHLEIDSEDEEMPGKEVTEITVDRKLLKELL